MTCSGCRTRALRIRTLEAENEQLIAQCEHLILRIKDLEGDPPDDGPWIALFGNLSRSVYLIRLYFEAPGVIENEAAARSLGQFKDCISPTTIRVRVCEANRLLKEKKTGAKISSVRGVGYVMAPDSKRALDWSLACAPGRAAA